MIDQSVRKEIEGLMKKYHCRDTALLPSISLVQDKYGFLSEESMEDLAKIFRFPLARIFSTASFYSMIKLHQKGKYHIQVCTNVSCSLLESETLFDYLSSSLGLDSGETSPDGLFSLEAVECLGACGYAPVMIINNQRYEEISFDDAGKIISSLRSKGTDKD